jgi:hypothetical protein
LGIAVKRFLIAEKIRKGIIMTLISLQRLSTAVVRQKKGVAFDPRSELLQR